MFRRTTKEYDDIYRKRWRFKRRVDEEDNNEWHISHPYSTTWEGMRLVAEEVGRRKMAWRIEGLRAAVFDPYAGSPADDGTMIYEERIGETPPHAFALAALAAIKALGGEQDADPNAIL